MNIILWGSGRGGELVFESIDKEICSVVSVVDRDSSKAGKLFCDTIRVEPVDAIYKKRADYIIVTMMNVQDKEFLKDVYKAIDKSKVIIYWEDDISRYSFFDTKVKEIYLLKKENLRLKKRLENAYYEYNENAKKPLIENRITLLNIIIKEHRSLCRFGDGEFEMIFQRERPWFQKSSKELSSRLRQIIEKEKKAIIAIPDIFGSLSKYNDTNADNIRDYITGGTRDRIYEVIDFERTYFDAYVTRPYIMYRDRGAAKEVFELYKKIWKGKDILIVEGAFGRMGYNNDLLEEAKSIRRIICPPKNSFEKIDVIRSTAIKYAKQSDLILVSLGPAATVLSCDLTHDGFWALDIGQLDTEYEWFRHNAEERIPIPRKGVSEVMGAHEAAQLDASDFISQIICDLS